MWNCWNNYCLFYPSWITISIRSGQITQLPLRVLYKCMEIMSRVYKRPYWPKSQCMLKCPYAWALTRPGRYGIYRGNIMPTLEMLLIEGDVFVLDCACYFCFNRYGWWYFYNFQECLICGIAVAFLCWHIINYVVHLPLMRIGWEIKHWQTCHMYACS